MADTDSTSEAMSKSSAVSYRRQLRQAKRDGDDKKIVSIMKMRELERLTTAATQVGITVLPYPISWYKLYSHSLGVPPGQILQIRAL